MDEVVALLLKKLHTLDEPFRPAPVKASAHKCLMLFAEHIHSIRTKHCPKEYEEDYLIEKAFRKPKHFASDSDAIAYCRVNLILADEWLKELVIEMKGNRESITYKTFRKYRWVLSDGLFGMKPVIERLEKRKNSTYRFFEGRKNHHLNSGDVFAAARRLHMHGAGAPITLDRSASQVAAIFMLRQAMELKFERLIGVYFLDRKGSPPKLRHGFHYEFIKTHISFYDFKHVDFDVLQTIYDWCSFVVHVGAQPWPWHVSFAFEVCSRLYMDGEDNGIWSLEGGVYVKDRHAMQAAFVDHLRAHLCRNDNPPEVDWSIHYGRLEASANDDEERARQPARPD